MKLRTLSVCVLLFCVAAVVALSALTRSCVDKHIPRCPPEPAVCPMEPLPLPPKMTANEMNNRIQDARSAHASQCPECKDDITPDEMSHCMVEAGLRAMRVGSWLKIGTWVTIDYRERLCTWQWLGPSIEGYLWLVDEQRWEESYD